MYVFVIFSTVGKTNSESLKKWMTFNNSSPKIFEPIFFKIWFALSYLIPKFVGGAVCA